MEVRSSLFLPADTSYKKLEYFLKSKGISRRIITTLKYREGLLINGIPSTTIQPVFAGDMVELHFPKEDTLSCEPQKGDFSVLYEDSDLLAVDKATGVATHPALGTPDHTLGNFVSQYYLEEGHPMLFRPISRLDKETSGVLLIGKHALSHSILTEQMRNHIFRKKYLAIVSGVMENDHGTISFSIAREEETSLRRTCREDGKKAYTSYRLVAHTPHFSLLELEIKTGRTHQIRVHLQSIGHPIVGDPLYGTTPGKRLFLHSYETSFLHPITGEPMKITAPCDFHSILSTLENEESKL